MLLNESFCSLNKRGGQRGSNRGQWDTNRKAIFEINCQFHSACIPEDSHSFFYLLWKCNIRLYLGGFSISIFFILIFFFFILPGFRLSMCFFACKSCTQSLTFREIGQNVARLNTKFKRNIPHSSDSSIWFCLVKARRDWNSPIKINLKLIMAQSEGPDSSCLYVLQTPLFALSILTRAVFQPERRNDLNTSLQSNKQQLYQAHIDWDYLFIGITLRQKFLTTLNTRHIISHFRDDQMRSPCACGWAKSDQIMIRNTNLSIHRLRSKKYCFIQSIIKQNQFVLDNSITCIMTYVLRICMLT